LVSGRMRVPWPAARIMALVMLSQLGVWCGERPAISPRVHVNLTTTA
jgi:hypothetical protein